MRRPLGEGESQREEEGEGKRSLDSRVPHTRVDKGNGEFRKRSQDFV